MNKKIALLITGAVMAFTLFYTGCSVDTSADVVQAFVNPYISVHPASRAYRPNEVKDMENTLSIEIWDWRGDDGSLSYQWYSFDDIQDYLDNGGAGHAIDGETGTEYTLPSNLIKTPGKKYYYYVTVTNSNSSAIDRTSGTIRSEVAIISFISDAIGEQPIITRHPVSSTYIFGSSMAPLGVKLKKLASASTVISYQWFTSDKDTFEEIDIENGTPLDEGVFESYMANPRTMKLGGNFYWVVVKNTPTSGLETSEISVPARITLNPAARAMPPRIMKQPSDRTYFLNQAKALEPIKFDAESPDFGHLTYQWYSNTSLSNSGGTAININGTGESYTPTVDLTDPTANFYYYVLITNTNNNVTGAKTAVLASKPVQVSVRSASTTGANATISIDDSTDPNNRYNYVRGYGGMNVAWTNFPEEKKEDTQKMYGNGPDELGYNIMRIMIMPWNTNIDIMMSDLVDNGPRPDFYESVRIVNRNGGYVLASPWSPPKEWKSNNSINGGGHLIKAYYRQFANYLKNFAQHMYDRGAPIYAVSIANEPNYVAGYDGCEWSDNEMRDFFKEVGHFTNGVRGYGGGKEIPVVLTVNGESANTPYINFAALSDPVSRAAIDFCTRHVYGEQRKTLWDTDNQGRTHASYKEGSPIRFECWMTEHNINSANATAYPNDSTWNYVWRFMNDVDLVMRLNNENAFVWWASKRFYSMLGDHQFGTTMGVPTVRGWGLSHYAKYTIDSTRVSITVAPGSTNGAGGTITQGGEPDANTRTNTINSGNFHLDNLSAKITAYVSADGEEYTMVMWTPTKTDGTLGTNMGRIQINLPGDFTIGNASAVRTIGAGLENTMRPEVLELSDDRKSAFVSLPASQIVSIRFTK
jgi:O-glycosyl hydrolase